jgi:hypothetical protein
MTENPNPKKNINVNIQSETDNRLEELARLTYRTKGAVIDWLVALKFTELTAKPQPEAEV